VRMLALIESPNNRGRFRILFINDRPLHSTGCRRTDRQLIFIMQIPGETIAPQINLRLDSLSDQLLLLLGETMGFFDGNGTLVRTRESQAPSHPLNRARRRRIILQPLFDLIRAERRMTFADLLDLLLLRFVSSIMRMAWAAILILQCFIHRRERALAK